MRPEWLHQDEHGASLMALAERVKQLRTELECAGVSGQVGYAASGVWYVSYASSGVLYPRLECRRSLL